MAAKATVTTVILFEDEVRLAAKALTAWLDLPDDAPDEQRDPATENLLNALIAALSGADNDDAILMLGRKSDMMLRAVKVGPRAKRKPKGEEK